jgi:sialic acid synthase SpsE
MKGVDHAFSLNPDAMKDLVKGIREAEKALGSYARNLSKEELGSRQIVRRSIAARFDIKKGDVFNRNNLKLVRPGTGIHPRYFEQVQGKKALVDIEKEDLITWEMIG